MRVGVYGGSFHPPHVGHALVASWLLWTERVDAVWLVPTYAHAFGKELAPFATRAVWCEALAQTVGPAVSVSGIEEELGGVSYTIDTLDALAARHPDHVFQLVVGSDVLPDLARWHAWDRIEAGYAPIVVGRAGHAEVPGAPTFPDVSSTAIRAALAHGDDISQLVPAAVLRAIRATQVAAGRGPS